MKRALASAQEYAPCGLPPSFLTSNYAYPMILTETLLESAFARTKKTIALFIAEPGTEGPKGAGRVGSKWADLQPDEMAVIFASGKPFEAHGTEKRVRYVRLFGAVTPIASVDVPRPELPFQPCYLNQAAPVLRFWADQVTPGVGSMLDSFV